MEYKISLKIKGQTPMHHGGMLREVTGFIHRRSGFGMLVHREEIVVLKSFYAVQAWLGYLRRDRVAEQEGAAQ